MRFDNDLFQYYQSLIRIRNENEALRRGDLRTLLTDDVRNVFVFERITKESQFIVLINKSEKQQDVRVTLNSRW